jgi:hypothetical protein
MAPINPPPEKRLRTLVLLLTFLMAMFALLFAGARGWSEYEGFVKRQKLTPIPVPGLP